MIEVDGLRKTYGELIAVDGITLRAQPGAIFGLLGPNGAGKSTTIGCISGLLRPDSGTVRVCGHDVQQDAIAARRSLGVVPQELAIYEDLSATENLRFFGATYGLRGSELQQRVDETLDAIGLRDRARDLGKTFSGGMKRRLNFGCGIVHRPRVLLLDEPTVGVDPQSRARLLDLVREQARLGITGIYTTHYMEEAESLCHRIAVVDHGKVIAEGTLDELRARLGGRELLRLAGRFDAARLRHEFGALPGVEIVQCEAEVALIGAPGASKRLPELLAAAARAGAELRETTLKQPSLESLFLELTGRELRE
jgi:ABC-2 type transport system ATP-binding protein